MAPQGFEDKVAFVWKVADKLRGTFKQHEYGSVMLPLLVLRRMDAVLAPTKAAGSRQGQGHVPDDRPRPGRAAQEGRRAAGSTTPRRLRSRPCSHDDKNVADNLAPTSASLQGG
jgi:type I restriction enzyme M protein